MRYSDCFSAAGCRCGDRGVQPFRNKMKTPSLTPGKAKIQSRARDRMIHEEMRFLLQPDEGRFARLLRAKLLEEGCNLPLCLARPAFYSGMLASLSSRLEGAARNELAGLFPAAPSRMDHPAFHKIMRRIEGRLPDAGPLMVRASLDALSTVQIQWLIPADVLCRTAETLDACLQAAVNQMAATRPCGRIGGLAFGVVRRRMRLALATSLLTYLRDPPAFHAIFGPVPRCFQDMERDPNVFCRVMAFFFEQLPCAGHLASQAFWRLLQTLDTEIPPEACPSC